MSIATEPDLKCEDVLKNNGHLYAHKAKRKKIVLISVEAVSRHSTEITIDFAASKLVAGENSYSVESPEVLTKKFSEFTWDFVVYAILDFHPLLAIVDAILWLSGPLYNRRLRKQLQLLSGGEMVLRPGERKKAILGFRGVTQAPTHLHFSYRCEDGEPQQMTREVR